MAAALVVAGLLASGIWVPSHSGRVAHRAATGSRLGELPQAARGAVSRALGQGEPRFRARRTAGRLTLSAAAAGAGARFSRLGALIDVGGASWSIGLRAFGRGRRLVPVAPASPAAYANRVRFGRPGIDEWYAASPIGIEQGFTVPARPRGASGTPLRLDLGRLPVWARARLARDGRSLLLERRGRELVRYSGLYARDAAGHALGARIELTGGRLSLSVDDRGARYPVGIDPFVAAGNMTASDGAAHDSFGWSVAVAGDTIAVGAPDARVGAHDGQGAVYVFVKQAAGWASPETAKLTASDGGVFDSLGKSVAISGDTIVAGAPNGMFSVSGAAYVFVKPPGGWASGHEQAKLTASDGSGLDKLGWSVSIAGDLVAVGAPGRQTGAGGVYVFAKPAAGWSSGQETARLTASDAAAGANVGASVTTTGDVIAAGAPFAAVSGHSAQGAVYVFARSGAAWSTGTEAGKLTAADGAAQDDLGYSVAMAGDTIAAGARFANIGMTTGAGAVYVYVKPQAGWASGAQTAKLIASDGGFNDNLGWSTAISGDTVAAGAPSAAVSGHFGQGAVYVFAKPAAGWANGPEGAKLTASDGAAGDQFGLSVGAASGAVVAGAPSAAVSGHAGQGASYAFTGSISVGGGGPAATTTTVSCAPSSVTAGQSTGCTEKVSNSAAGGVTPTGTVTLATDSSGSFGSGGACTLAPTATAGVASCSLTYTPTSAGSGLHSLTGTYLGDASHAASQGRTSVTVTRSPGGGGGAGGGGPPPATLTAVLNVTPSPTCVGSVTRFDATGSRGAPIVHYHFQYTEPGVKQEFGFDEPDPDHPRTVTISDGTGADATWVFPWNRGQNFSIPIPGLPGNATSFRDPVTAQVTVTDATGATAQASAPVPFLQTTRSYDGSWTRSPDCPSVAPSIPAFPFPLSAVGVSPVVAPSGPLIVTVPCRSLYQCSGVLSITATDIATSARARRRAPKPIALTSFEIAPHATAKVRAPLSKAGRRLLRQRKHLRVRVTLMYLSPTGAKGVTRSKTAKIALKRHGRH